MVHVKSSSSSSNNITLELLMSVSGNALIYPSNKVLIQNVMRSICVRQETLVAEAEMRRMQLEEESRLRAEQDAEYQASCSARNRLSSSNCIRLISASATNVSCLTHILLITFC